MRTILIPTDFTIESLNTVKAALNQREGEKINLILVYGLQLSDSITDLLFYSRDRYLDMLENEKFTEACEILKNKYDSQLESINVELFTGYTQGAFTNFMEGLGIDELFMPASYQFKKGKRGFDLLPYFRKASLPITEVGWHEARNLPEKDLIAELFLAASPH